MGKGVGPYFWAFVIGIIVIVIAVAVSFALFGVTREEAIQSVKSVFDIWTRT